MKSDTSITVPAKRELDVLKVRIAEYDDGFRRAYSDQMGYAFLAGMAILRAKAILSHGMFLPWIEDATKLHRASANRYARFAEAMIEAHPQLNDCAAATQIEERVDIKDLSESEQKEILSTVHEIADGKTLTELYRDLGVIRQPKKQKHTPKKVTPEEEEESAQLLAEERGNALLGDMRQLLHEWTEYQSGGPMPAIARWPRKLLLEIESVRIELGKVAKGILKKSKVKLHRNPKVKGGAQ